MPPLAKLCAPKLASPVRICIWLSMSGDSAEEDATRPGGGSVMLMGAENRLPGDTPPGAGFVAAALAASTGGPVTDT